MKQEGKAFKSLKMQIKQFKVSQATKYSNTYKLRKALKLSI